MKSEYRKLLDRFRALHADVEIVSDIAYWPIESLEPQQVELDATKTEIYRFVLAGYDEKAALRNRLRRIAGLDHHIAYLVEQGWLLEREDSGGRCIFQTAKPLDELPAPEAPRKRQHYDAVSRTMLDLPITASLTKSADLDPAIPIIADPDFVSASSDTLYLECLLLLVLSGPTKARSVHVFHQRDEIISLQEILYDLVLDGSQRLKGTQLRELPNLKIEATPPQDAAASVRPIPLPVTNKVHTTRGQSTDRSRPTVEPTTPTNSNLIREGPRSQPAERGASTQHEERAPALTPERPPEIIFGQKSHEQILGEAFREATKHVVIVAPFIRRRINEIEFKRQLLAALRRGVSVSVIHGMPSHADQFDDTPYENQRIENLAKEAGRHHHRLKFIRVTSIPNSVTGEHSKILICDDRWAVVTSFNWLSVAETNETGVRFRHQETVAELLQLFDNYLKPSQTKDEVRSEVTSPWPLKAREMSEWIYGEYNSQ